MEVIQWDEENSGQSLTRENKGDLWAKQKTKKSWKDWNRYG